MKSPFAAAMLAGLALAAPAPAADPVHTVEGLAVSGYDAVAYFTQGTAVKGRPAFEAP